MNTQEIHAEGVLLIQRQLLKYDIKSEPMEAHAGIDFRAYVPNAGKVFTVVVRTSLRPTPAGGKGRPSLGCWLHQTSRAELVGLAYLEGDQAWLFLREEFEAKAQQKPKDRFHLYFYVEPEYRSRPGTHQRDFERFVINEHRIQKLFGIPIQT
jgi:hypothetical protein